MAHDISVNRALMLCLTKTGMGPEEKREIYGYRFFSVAQRPHSQAAGVAIYTKLQVKLQPIELGELYGHGGLCTAKLPQQYPARLHLPGMQYHTVRSRFIHPSQHYLQTQTEPNSGDG